MEPPTWGRPSPATAAPVPLRAGADASTAAYRADGGSLPGLEVRAATVAGPRHRLAGGRGEDAYAWAAGGGRLAVAVADGVGTTPNAAEAAARAAPAACRAALVAEDPLEGCRRAVAAAASDVAEGAPAGATTLVIAVVGTAGDDVGTWAAARVGDSSAFELRAEQWREVFAPAGADEAIETTTPALPTGVEGLEEATGRLEAGDVLVLLTDGVADPLRDGPETVAPPLAELLASLPSPLELAAAADFARQGCLDDRTVVAVFRSEVDAG